MVKTLFGKKMGMTRYFLEEGKSIPVTIVKLGPCVVIQKKTADKDGYNAIQVGFEPQVEKHVNKPMKGHFKAAGEKLFRHLREIRVESTDPFELGQELGRRPLRRGRESGGQRQEQGTGFCRGGEALGVFRRQGHPRVSGPPGTGLHRNQHDTRSCRQGTEAPRSHGVSPPDRSQLESAGRTARDECHRSRGSGAGKPKQRH